MRKKTWTAAMMGRKGGKVGGRVRAERLSPERRRQIAAMGGKAKWAKERDKRKREQ